MTALDSIVPIPVLTEKQISRFWSRVEKNPDGCWLWTGGKDISGYGRFSSDGQWLKAHRVMYSLTFGLIPTGKLVCHHCDNPSCVRPDHLFVGTDKDNAQDKSRKGRGNSPLGSKHGRAKLTEDIVVSIRNVYATGNVRLEDIANVIGVHLMTVDRIVFGRRWKHCGGEISKFSPGRIISASTQEREEALRVLRDAHVLSERRSDAVL